MASIRPWIFGILGLGTLFLCIIGGVHSARSDHSRLIKALLSKYEKDALPARNTTDTVVGKIGLSVLTVKMDDKEQTMTLNAWVDMEWVDYRLSWSPSDYNGIENVKLDYKKIWRPDFALYDAYEPQSIIDPAFEGSLATVSRDGNVFFAIHTTLRGGCPMDLRSFPYDRQLCRFKIGSWAYHGFLVDVKNRSEVVDLSNYKMNPRWELKNVSTTRNVVRYACCPEPYPDVTFQFKVTRRPGQLALVYISPAFILALLVPLVFLLPYGGGDKTILAVGIQLCAMFMVYSLQDYINSDSSMSPIIIKYYGLIFICVTAALITTTVVNAVIGGCSRGPPDLLYKVFSCCGCCLCAGSEPKASKSESMVMGVMAEGYRKQAAPSKTPREKWTIIATVIDRLSFISFAVLIACGVASYFLEMASLAS